MPKSIKIDQYRYMTTEAWRVLMAVEMGMKNHEFVPADLVHKISHCSRRGSSFLKLLKDDLVPHGLLAYETDARKSYSGYRLTNLGYDYLALHAMIKSGQIINLGSMIGAGKESDVYLAVAGENAGRIDEFVPENEAVNKHRDVNIPTLGEYVVIKFHRLGRTSFRKVKEKREYHSHRGTCSWLYLDRLAASREYNMMEVLYDNGLPVPCPLANNRNAVVMSLLSDAIPLSKVLPSTLRANEAAIASSLYHQAIDIFRKITQSGLIHGDFNEFNLLVGGLTDTDTEPSLPSFKDFEVEDSLNIDHIKLILIDFPQMISRDHRTGQELYERDLNGILSFFSRYLEIEPDSIPPTKLEDVPRIAYLDVELKAPGYPKGPISSVPRRSRNTDESDVLIGTVASLRLNEESSNVETDGDEDEGTDVSESVSEDEEDQDNNACEDKAKPTDVMAADGSVSQPGTLASMASNKRMAVANTVISREEVRDRIRREEKRREQEKFRLRIKRQVRANRKRQGRTDITTEINMFE